MKKRILIVDDDPLLIEIYTRVIHGRSDRWEVTSATSGKQALEKMETTEFAAVISDMRMPGMTGAELITAIRQRFPRTSRIILSGIADQEEVAHCLGTTHQFVPKPVDMKTLLETLARISNLDSFLMDEKLKALVGSLDALPSFPSLYLEVTKELASPDPSIERIAEIVARDPAMTAQMLHMVNSAAFGLARKISNPLEAIQHLGTGTVRSLVLSVHVFSSFDQTVKGFSIEQFGEHALRCATLARAISKSQRVESAMAEDAYTAGMLHDIGRLMLASSLPDKFQEAMAYSVAHQITLSAAETEVFGATHAGVGAYLLGLWGLPAPIVEAVAFHHTPGSSDLRTFQPLTAVHVADMLEAEHSKLSRPMPLSGLDAEYLTAVKVQNQLGAWRKLAQKMTS